MCNTFFEDIAQSDEMAVTRSTNRIIQRIMFGVELLLLLAAKTFQPSNTITNVNQFVDFGEFHETIKLFPSNQNHTCVCTCCIWTSLNLNLTAHGFAEVMKSTRTSIR